MSIKRYVGIYNPNANNLRYINDFMTKETVTSMLGRRTRAL